MILTINLDSNHADNSNLGMVCLRRGATQVLDAMTFVRFPVEVIICRYTTAPYALFEALQNLCNLYASTL